MRIVIAPDAFKECLSAHGVATAIANGVRRAVPESDLVLVPMADGGEGTVDALVAATGGTYRDLEVMDPLGESVTARYGVSCDGSTAFIEMAAASGLALVPRDRRDPRITTTHGTGELMANALDLGVKRIVLGIGGSATNDGGAGMAQALGFSLRDAGGHELPPGGAALARLAAIDDARRHPALATCDVVVACDVDNPLCGPTGASLIYGPQKGASPHVALELDAALARLAEVVRGELNIDILDQPGSGAAGGLGGGLVAFAGACLEPGVDVVARTCGLAQHMQGAHLVITGEGAVDRQTLSGKTPVGVARMACEQGIPVIALAGSLGEGYRDVYGYGIDAVHSICPGPITLAEAIDRTRELLADTAETVLRTWLAGQRAR